METKDLVFGNKSWKDDVVLVCMPERDDDNWPGQYEVWIGRNFGKAVKLREFGEDREAAVAFALQLAEIMYGQYERVDGATVEAGDSAECEP